jgi:hypothetical protein
MGLLSRLFNKSKEEVDPPIPPALNWIRDTQMFIEYAEPSTSNWEAVEYTDDMRQEIENWHKGRVPKVGKGPSNPNSMPVEHAAAIGLLTKDEEIALTVDRLRQNVRIEPVRKTTHPNSYWDKCVEFPMPRVVD